MAAVVAMHSDHLPRLQRVEVVCSLAEMRLQSLAETEEAGNSSCRVPMLITDVLQVVVSQLDLMVAAEVEHMFELCRARAANSGAQEEEEEGLLARREGEYLDSDEAEDDDD